MLSIVNRLSALISLILLGAIFYFSDELSLDRLGDAVTSPWALLVVLLLCIQNISAGMRWWLCVRLLNGCVPMVQAVRTTLIGLFYTNVLPSALGLEGYRLLVGKLSGVSLRTLSVSIVFEKLAGLAPLSLVIIALPHVIPAGTGWRVAAQLGVGIYLAGLLLATFFFVRNREVVFPTLLPLVEHAPHLARRYLFALVITSLVSGALLIAGLLVSWSIVMGALPSLSDAALLPIVVIVSALPISIGGWGLREGAFVSLYAGGSLSFDQALLIGLLYGAMQTIASVIGLVAHALPGAEKQTYAADKTP